MFLITSDQNSIHYMDQGPKGHGIPMVLVPGWGYSSEVFCKQVEYFGKNHRVIAMDPRGHGKSTGTDVSHQRQAKDLIELLEALEIEKAVLIGWSYGAYPVLGVVRECGLKYVQKIVIIDQPPKCTGTAEDGWVEYFPENLERARIGLGTVEGYRKGVENFAKHTAFLGDLAEEELRKICNMADLECSLAVKEFFSGAQCDFSEEAKKVDEQGKLEFIVREQWGKQARAHLKTLCPNAGVHVLGGHMMFYEFPEEFNRILEKVL
ncbi:MAG: alpha/beta fold hydrolase [Lachnospiraceae bacterium]